MKKGLFWAVLFAAAGCAGTSINTVQKEFSFPALTHSQQVKAAVFRACGASGWTCKPVSPDTAEAACSFQGQTLWADIYYTPRMYRITYKHASRPGGAAPVQASPAQTARQYNRRVSQLSAQIDKQLAYLNQTGLKEFRPGESL